MKQRASGLGPIDGLDHGPSGRLESLATLYPGLRRLAWVAADPDMDPDDLVHDVLVGFLRLRQPVNDVPAYLRRSVINAAARERSRRARGHQARARAAAELQDSTGDAYPSHVVAILTVLSPKDRALLYLVDVEGEPLPVAAETLGLSAAAARARASRARRRVRRLLTEGSP